MMKSDWTAIAAATTFVLHRVRNDDGWRKVYDRVAEVQNAGGVTAEAVYRAEDDPNNMLVMHRFGTREQAHAFFESNPDPREALGNTGVDMSIFRLEFFNEA